MNKRVLPAAIIVATGAALAFPIAAFAGSKGQTTCSESFAKWHVSIEQPEGGYVTIDFGRDGVDYTTTVWQVSEMTPLGARFSGSTIRVQWHAADGTVLREKGNGVPVAVQECQPTTTQPTTTQPATTQPATTQPATTQPTTTAPPTTQPVAPTTVTEVTTTVSAPTTTVVPVTTVAEPTTTLQAACPVGFANESNAAAQPNAVPAGCPGRLTNDRITTTTVPARVTTVTNPTVLLPATGPDQAGPTAIVGALTLGLGMLLTAVTRRSTRA